MTGKAPVRGFPSIIHEHGNIPVLFKQMMLYFKLMKISRFSAFVSLAMLVSGLPWSSYAEPNVLFIFADDPGWGDLGCYGHQEMLIEFTKPAK